MDLSFLRSLTFSSARLTFEAVDDLELPTFPGSALRGVLGRRAKSRLCPAGDGDPGESCWQRCRQPERCPYFALFERERAGADGSGENIPRPLILRVPSPLERFVHCGARQMQGFHVDERRSGAPVLRSAGPLKIAAGGRFQLGLTVVGREAGRLLPLVVAIADRELERSGRRFRLCKAVDAGDAGRVLPDPPAVRDFGWALRERYPDGAAGIEAHLLSPLRIRAGHGRPLQPEPACRAFFELALVRAVKLYNAFCAAAGERLPFLELPPHEIRPQRLRLFRFELPRVSSRQERVMRFDGLVGSFLLENAPESWLPLARVAETLHLGQKGAFGLGRVRVRYSWSASERAED